MSTTAKFMGWVEVSDPETSAGVVHAQFEALVPAADIDEMAYAPESATSPACSHCRAIVRAMLDAKGDSQPE